MPVRGLSRLTRPRDFAAARKHGRSWADRWLVLVARPNSLDASRVGFSVGKRIGGAVKRNKTKRRLREAVRHAPVRTGWDLVLIAREDARQADYQRLSRSATGLMRRAGLLAPLANGTPTR